MDWSVRKSLRDTAATALAGMACLIAAQGTASAETQGTSLMNFQVNGIGAFQNEAESNSMSGQIGWTPRYALGESFGVRGDLAASFFKGSLSNFFVGEAQVLGSYALSSFLIEAGGGVQSWFGQDVTSPMASANLAWQPSAPWFGMVDRVFAGYSYLFDSSVKAHEVKIGIGIAL